MPTRFTPEELAELETIRWPDGARCPACNSADCTRTETARGAVFRCNECSRPFTALQGTIMQGSRVTLRQWIDAYHLVTLGSSVRDVASTVRVAYATAYKMTKQLRHAVEHGDITTTSSL